MVENRRVQFALAQLAGRLHKAVRSVAAADRAHTGWQQRREALTWQSDAE